MSEVMYYEKHGSTNSGKMEMAELATWYNKKTKTYDKPQFIDRRGGFLTHMNNIAAWMDVIPYER